MSVERKIKQRTERRALRVRKKLKNVGLPRLSVFRSLNHIYAQVIDDQQQKTLVSYSSRELDKLTGDKKNVAELVGKELAKRALQAGISQVILDRGPFLYHGRIKAFATGAREAGLKI